MVEKNGNPNKIAFIICTNHPQYLEECLYYLNRLIVPDGMDMDVLTVTEAESMTSGYNEAMQASDAKYKVYLHQDVFILNQNLIGDMVRIFESDEQIGMIGTLGAVRLPDNASAWDHWDTGSVYTSDTGAAVRVTNAMQKPWTEVEGIDGMFMATSVDVPWKEDFSAFDFYDVSQCLEMTRNGYKTVVPYQEEAWILHDSGYLNFSKYDEWRKRCCEIYPERFTYEGPLLEDRSRNDALVKQVLQMIEQLLQRGAYDQVDETMQDLQEVSFYYHDLTMLLFACEIREMEQQQLGEDLLWRREVSDPPLDLQTLKQRITAIRFLIRRFELGMIDADTFATELSIQEISWPALILLTRHTTDLERMDVFLETMKCAVCGNRAGGATREESWQQSMNLVNQVEEQNDAWRKRTTCIL